MSPPKAKRLRCLFLDDDVDDNKLFKKRRRQFSLQRCDMRLATQDQGPVSPNAAPVIHTQAYERHEDATAANTNSAAPLNRTVCQPS